MTERPDPDVLLARVQQEEARAARGRLKIYLGAAPGVGKTFAMLSAARRLLAQGRDVAVGIVETHGRVETQMLLAGLEVLPRRVVHYRGRTLDELDLDAALARKAEILVVDELAHTTAPGSRHAKRWQEVGALLEAGTSVLTTLNVQHIESLNDVVAQISGVQVRETVPDAVFDEADEVELVDLPPDVLLERMRAGKVYVPESVQVAVESFFRKGNLTALRELALRKTAQWVDAQLQRYKQEQGVRRIWPAGDRIMVCVGPSPLSARLVRTAHRVAAATHAELFAVFVETPFTARRLSRTERERVFQHLRLAESLGARTATLEGRDAASTVIAFARDHNVGRIVLGKSRRSRWKELLLGSFTMELVRASGDIDVHVVRAENGEAPAAEADQERAALASRPWGPPRDHLAALAYVAVATGAAWAMHRPPDLSAEAMIMILGVVLAALRRGTGPSVLAAVASVLAFNFLFTAPRFTFAVADPAYLVAFLVMLLVGLAISSLVNEVRVRAEAAQERERETSALYSLTRELAEAQTNEDIARITVAHLRDAIAGDIAFLAPAGGEGISSASVLATFGQPDWLGPHELGVARWCWAHGRPAGEGTSNLPGTNGLFLPLATRQGRNGVLALRRAEKTAAISSKRRLLVETFAEQAALALERVNMAEERQRARQQAETERLRSTLLASVSHDLRTPLATITGAASSLVDDGGRLTEPARRELAGSILEQSRRLNDLIANLVFATRLESGDIELRKEWTSIEEVIGAALRRAQDLLHDHALSVYVPASLPLVEADPVLLEQGLYILLENAARHTPKGTRVEVVAWTQDASLFVEVSDDGPGVRAGDQARVFQRWVSGPRSAGMGLGLAICEGIFKAHGGRAWIEPGRERGAAFRVLLPLPAEQARRPVEAEGGSA